MARRRQRGFTLIEMMVVVAIIGVLSIFFVSLSARTYGTNADNIADEINAQLNFAHARAVSTRRYHCVEVKGSMVLVYVNKTGTGGMKVPTIACPTSTDWDEVQRVTLPKQTSIWNYDTAADNNTGATPADLSATLDKTSLLFRPDGSVMVTGTAGATGATIFIADKAGTRKDRVIVYAITGDVYTRKQW